MILPLILAAVIGGFTAVPPFEMVKITDKYSMGKTEVTQGTWFKLMGTNPSKFGDKSWQIGTKSPDPILDYLLPVENVNYYDCIKFIDKLNLKYPTKHYRLPTNDEWTYACNGGKKTKFFFGDDPSQLGIVAWYRENCTTPTEVKKGDWQALGGQTHPVGTKMANQFGLYDMHGNVMEWVAEGDMRGGSWFSIQECCQTAYISRYDKKTRCEYLGFRLVCEDVKK